MTLIEEIKLCIVPPFSVALWWLGQSSFVLKSPSGTTLAIDPYLSNSCKEPALRVGLDYDRRSIPPIEPEALSVDAIALTHSHQDHCDPETITRHRASGFRGPYLAPGETMEKLTGLGVSPAEIILTWPNKVNSLGDIRLMSTFAIPPAGDDVTHTGYLIFIEMGPTIYFTGDTDYHEVLGYIAEHRPEIMVTVINGVGHNLGPGAAAKLTSMINPEIVIPCHHDLFADNSMDPRIFRACLHSEGIAEKYVQLHRGERFIYTARSAGE